MAGVEVGCETGMGSNIGSGATAWYGVPVDTG